MYAIMQLIYNLDRLINKPETTVFFISYHMVDGEGTFTINGYQPQNI